MMHRASIARMMLAVIVASCGLAILRSWTRGADVLGEMDPMAAVVLLGTSIALVTTGRFRRFSAGVAASGLVVAPAIWAAPHPVRDAVLTRVLIPVEREILPPLMARCGPIEYSQLWVGRRPEPFRFSRSRSPFRSPESVLGLGLFEAMLAVAGGMLAAIVPRRRPATGPAARMDNPMPDLAGRAEPTATPP